MQADQKVDERNQVDASISYAITAHDEWAELASLLSRIHIFKKECDEVVVLVDGSDEEMNGGVSNVCEVCEKFNFMDHAIRWRKGSFDRADFANWKNQLLANDDFGCRNDFVFWIDADELPSMEIMRDIHLLLGDSGRNTLFRIANRNMVPGITEEYAASRGWKIPGDGLIRFPDFHGRIHARGAAKWFGNVHEKLRGPEETKDLDPSCYYLDHPKSFAKQVRQNALYDGIRNGNPSVITAKPQNAPRKVPAAAVYASFRLGWKYVREWCEYHLGIGFDHVFVDNNENIGDTRTVDAISDLISSGKVTVIDHAGIGFEQEKFQEEALSSDEAKKYDWIAFVDMDEFVMVDTKKYGSFKNWLSRPCYDNADVIRLNWWLVDDDGESRVRNGNWSLLKRFKNHIPDERLSKNGVLRQSSLVKSIVRMGRRPGMASRPSFLLANASPHAPAFGESQLLANYCDARGNVSHESNRMFIQHGNEIIHSDCWIQHFWGMTIQEYLARKLGYSDNQRGERVHRGEREFFGNYDRTQEKELVAAQILRAGINPWSDMENAWKERCIVVSPRHDFIRSWIRSYFASGNILPLVIIPGPEGDWSKDDYDYCGEAAKFTGGLVFDCSSAWKAAEGNKDRAVKKSRVGWFSKKNLLLAVARDLRPFEWAWIDDDLEIRGDILKCFNESVSLPGFVTCQFYNPNPSDIRHPANFFRSHIDPDDKIGWNSVVFFHGEANGRLAEAFAKPYKHEDDEIIFGTLYKTDPVWHEGFSDIPAAYRQLVCKRERDLPSGSVRNLFVHYTSYFDGMAVKNAWRDKASRLPRAPFEFDQASTAVPDAEVKETEDPVDAVFVLGTGSMHNNEEFRYALRNLEVNCPFVRRVYLSGFCPAWVDRSRIIHLDVQDRFYHAKDANIIDKLLQACKQPGIAKRILFCSDDQFQTRVCTWDDFKPRYLRRFSLDDPWYANKNRTWHTRLRETLVRDFQRRRAAGLDTSRVFYYQPHMWMQIDRDAFIQYAAWSDYPNRTDTIIASGYMNFADVDGVPDFDHRFLDAGSPAISGKECHLAYHDDSEGLAMSYLRDRFPNPSRFERADSEGRVPTFAPRPWSKPVATVNQAPLLQDPVPRLPQGGPTLTASFEEERIIGRLRARIETTQVWMPLKDEVEEAETMRRLNAKGWRKVWNDILMRWRLDTMSGAKLVPVTSPRSTEALNVLSAFKASRIGTPNPGHVVSIASVFSENTEKKSSFTINYVPNPLEEDPFEGEKTAQNNVKTGIPNDTRTKSENLNEAVHHLSRAIAYLASGPGLPSVLDTQLARGEVSVGGDRVLAIGEPELYTRFVDLLGSQNGFGVQDVKGLLQELIGRLAPSH